MEKCILADEIFECVKSIVKSPKVEKKCFLQNTCEQTDTLQSTLA